MIYILRWTENESNDIPIPSIINLEENLEQSFNVSKTDKADIILGEEAIKKMIMGEESVTVGKVKKSYNIY